MPRRDLLPVLPVNHDLQAAWVDTDHGSAQKSAKPALNLGFAVVGFALAHIAFAIRRSRRRSVSDIGLGLRLSTVSGSTQSRGLGGIGLSVKQLPRVMLPPRLSYSAMAWARRADSPRLCWMLVSSRLIMQPLAAGQPRPC